MNALSWGLLIVLLLFLAAITVVWWFSASAVDQDEYERKQGEQGGEGKW